MDEPGSIQLSLESIGDDSPMPLESAWSLLTGEEIGRAKRFHFEIHRNRFVRCRALLRRKLGSCLDRNPEAIVFKAGKRGKPFVPESGLAFNISHSGDVALFGFSRDLDEIGVDVEVIDRKIELEAISERYYTEGERKELSAAATGEKSRRFFEIWTAKEALMKLTGEGLHLAPGKIDIVFRDGLPIAYRKPEGCEAVVETIDFPQFGAVASVATPQPSQIELNQTR